MMHTEIHRAKTRLDDLFGKAASFSGDGELLSEWAKYLCVLASGFIEQSVIVLYRDHVRRRAKEDVALFAARYLGGFRNPKMDKIVQLAGGFREEWARELRQVEEELKGAVDSIVANRDNIAHGRSVGITMTSLRGYYRNAVKVLEVIERQTTPS